MPDLHTYLLFVATALLLNVTPGADMLFVTTQSARHGLKHGLAATAGIFTGTLCHIGFAVVGLSALLASSALAFTVVKWLGAAYLVWLGLQMWRSAGSADSSKAPPASPAAGSLSLWWRGTLVNLLNPKVALFFVAFLPQFVDPQATQHAMALLLLGLSFNLTGTLVNMAAAVLVLGAARLPVTRRLGRLLSRAVGTVFVGLGVKLALADAARP
ncbi:LysE family translocator [Salinisphaera sp. Q1T1-3]|uniref:LysE family translocator n=1 Tax=Salinisphaera sp. Q1T1-3 TaxID=2321229 RepID=UPI000E708339|nr:LysE family translocator [Salinisphaera sp. Q1T1-3]RJS93032.1 LysE family translocator [Salinisphaera sp. Q1T1-3]